MYIVFHVMGIHSLTIVNLPCTIYIYCRKFSNNNYIWITTCAMRVERLID